MTESIQKTPATPVRLGARLKNVALFFVSPFIALYYVALLPSKLIQLARAERLAATSSSAKVERS